jgi:hypothetical protein
MIHVDLVDYAHMPHSLRHDGVNSCLDRFFVMALQFQVRMREELVARHIVV